MIKQIATYGAFYLTVAAIAFRLSWWASDQLSTYAQEIDPHIERIYTK